MALIPRALIGGERSGVIRNALRARGIDAWSCDFAPCEDASPFHIEGDALWFAENLEPFDLFIGHPDCTYLCGSGLHWNTRRPERRELTRRAIADATRWFAVPTRFKCIENPPGALSRAIRKPDQYFQPYMFGDDASKKTGLWLWKLPPLIIPPRELWYPPRMVNGLPRWSNQTDSGQNRLGPSPDRSMNRARTYAGAAEAMAEQWAPILFAARS